MSTLPGGWVRLGNPTLRQRLALSVFAVGPPLLIGVNLIQIGVWLLHDLPLWASIPVILGGVAALYLLASLIHLRLNPTPAANFSSNQIRVRARTLAFDGINFAIRVGVEPESVAVRFGQEKGVHATVPLTSKGAYLLDSQTRSCLVEIVERSNIRMPTSQYDPSGKFARYNFPEHFDKEALLEMLSLEAPSSDRLPT